MTFDKLIKKWKLDYGVLADKMGMPLGTFKKKISGNQTAYNFTDDERKRLIKVLGQLGADVRKLNVKKES